MRTNQLLLFFISVLSSPLFAQFSFEYSDSIPVNKGTNTFDHAWAGGLNYAQFSEIDFDYDGDMDLFVFDRSSDNIRVFLQEEENGVKFYKLKYNAQTQFPTDLRYRATTVDFNNDGKMDLFVYGIGGIKVYKNVGNVTTGLQWVVEKNLLYSNYNGTLLNLYVSSADIPAIIDVDNDGDIDILTFHIGGEHLQYHQNQSMELYGVPDSLVFTLKNECWGGFREDINTNSVYLNDQSSPCNTGNVPNPQLPVIEPTIKPTEQTPKHSGSTVLALDIDNSGVLDLLLGDVSFSNLNLLINGGSSPNTNSLMVTSQPNFPTNSQPVNLSIFPAAFYLDVDFDGKKDLIVGANAKNISENETSIYYYKNQGTATLPVFIYQTKAFLQNEMIEHGTGSIPIFTDIDQDGLEDLLVANFFRNKPNFTKESSIAYYRNTGTATAPSFTFIDGDFLNLSNSGLGLRIVPTFGDLDGDGDADMILGLETGVLRYYTNNSASTVAFSSTNQNLTDNTGTPIQVGQYAAPQLFDLNQDGLLDLIIGKKTGELVYYQNTGTVSNPIFTLYNSFLGNIDIATNSPDGYPVPHFFKHNDTIYLFLGGIDGNLQYYTNISANLNPGNAFTLFSANFLQLNTGAYSSFWVNDIDNDGFLNLFVGQDLGGLYHLEVDPNSQASLPNQTDMWKSKIYPNPTSNTLTITTEKQDEIYVSIRSLIGQQIAPRQSFHHAITIDVSEYPSGVYILVLEDAAGNSHSKRISKY